MVGPALLTVIRVWEEGINVDSSLELLLLLALGPGVNFGATGKISLGLGSFVSNKKLSDLNKIDIYSFLT